MRGLARADSLRQTGEPSGRSGGARAPGGGRLADERGFALIEVIVATLLAAMAVTAVVGTLDASRRLTTSSERLEAATHVAQQEMERILALGYEQTAMPAPAPEHASDPLDPRHYIVSGDTPAYRWNHRPDAPVPHTEPLALASSGADPSPLVSSEPTRWDDGRLAGDVHRFVTWVDDARCGVDPETLCPGTEDFKRVTVAVTVDGDAAPRKPVVISALVSDPDSGPASGVEDGTQSPASDPRTECLGPGGELVECTGSVGDARAQTWFLYDTPATASVYQQITGDHPTHPTVAATGACTGSSGDDDGGGDGSGCAVPDLMGLEPPPAPAPLPPLYDYSSEVTGESYAGGRVLRRDVACDATPSEDNSKGQLWVTPPLDATMALTGDGGMTIHSQTLNGASAGAKLCVAFYDLAGSVSGLTSIAGVELGRASYEASSWPTSMSVASFSFDFRGALGDVAVLEGHRIGVRTWVAGSAGADLAVAYDHPTYPSSVQLIAGAGS